MNRVLKSYQIEHNKKAYPCGTRVELTADMAGESIRKGTCGTVVLVDDIGSIHVEWDNGRTLALIPGEDSFRRFEEREVQLLKPENPSCARKAKTKIRDNHSR